MPAYPLAFPDLHPAKVQMTKRYMQAAAVSPFTLAKQVLDWQASQWTGSITMQIMGADDAAIFGAFLAQLNGMVGTFTFDLNPWVKGDTPGEVTFRLAQPVHNWDSSLAVTWNFQIDVEEDV